MAENKVKGGVRKGDREEEQHADGKKPQRREEEEQARDRRAERV